VDSGAYCSGPPAALDLAYHRGSVVIDDVSDTLTALNIEKISMEMIKTIYLNWKACGLREELPGFAARNPRVGRFGRCRFEILFGL
jgi:hypothetical protein